MKNLKQLVNFISNGENRKAATFLKNIREHTACAEYACAREKLLLIEAAKMLNEDIPAFYVDTEKLAADLFSERVLSAEKVAKFLCDEVRSSVEEIKIRSFRKADDYIKQNLCDNQLSVSSVAEYTGVSGSTIAKIFMENTGVRPVDYIGNLRVMKSLDFLKQGMSVEKAGLEVGFSSGETYIRAFKRHMGTTPGEWKRNKLPL